MNKKKLLSIAAAVTLTLGCASSALAFNSVPDNSQSSTKNHVYHITSSLIEGPKSALRILNQNNIIKDTIINESNDSNSVVEFSGSLKDLVDTGDNIVLGMNDANTINEAELIASVQDILASSKFKNFILEQKEIDTSKFPTNYNFLIQKDLKALLEKVNSMISINEELTENSKLFDEGSNDIK